MPAWTVGVVIFHEDGYYWPMSHYGPAETEDQRKAIIAKVNYDDPISKETSLMARQLADLKAGVRRSSSQSMIMICMIGKPRR